MFWWSRYHENVPPALHYVGGSELGGQVVLGQDDNVELGENGILVICSHFPVSSQSIFTVRMWMGRGGKGAELAVRCCLLFSLFSNSRARFLELPEGASSSSSASSSNVSTYTLVVAVADLAMLVERKQEVLSESNDVHNTILYGACLQLLRQHLYFCTSKASKLSTRERQFQAVLCAH